MDLSKIWATSDTHFGHKNIIKYSKRPFNDTTEMDEAMIRNWNEVVDPSHTVLHLGDLAFSDEGRIQSILNRLNGEIIFIPGNHDKQIYKSHKLRERFKNAAMLHELAKRVDDDLRGGLTFELEYPSTGRSGMVVFSHYAHLVWNKSHHGSLMLHGHSHGSLRYPAKMRMMDVGVDPNNFYPVQLSDAIKRLEKIEPPTFDHHGE